MPHILAADDCNLVLEVLESVLRPRGFQVTTAKDGLEAISLFDENDFDLVITDIHMPGADGNTLLRRAKQIALEIPVIAVTGSPEDPADEFDRILSKPISIITLMATIDQLLGRRN